MQEDKLVIRPKHPKGEGGYKTFSIRIREELVEKIDKVSAQSGRSRNELIGTFLEFALSRCEVDKKED